MVEQAGGFRCKGDLVLALPLRKGQTFANLSPTLPFTAARARFRHPDFLGRCSRECTAFQGVSSQGVYGIPRSLVAGSVRHSKESRLLSPTFGLRSVQLCCFSVTLFSFLASRCCSEGGSSVDSPSARCRWAWRVMTRWRARPLLMLTL